MTFVLEFFKMNKDAIIALGVFISALVSVFGVLWASKAAHKSRVAEIRIRWVEALIDDVSAVLQTSLAADFGKYGDKQKAIETVFNAKKFLNKIMIRLNPDDEAQHNLSDLIRRYGLENDSNKKSIMEDLITKSANQVFQKEWRRAERGK